MKYRNDLNALRAIAVSAVVIFHFNPSLLSGGFAGVDIFFVISGYLMTAIIFEGINTGKGNLLSFYNSRLNRIVPALSFMMAVLIIFGWFFLYPIDYKELAQEIKTSTLFYSNIYFSNGGGYFDEGEHSKWLLHTWSLSVEWQFYLLFPIFIYIVRSSFGSNRVKIIVSVLFLFSFGYCIYLNEEINKSFYFLLANRGWEMLLGSIAYLYPVRFLKKTSRYVLQSIGLAFIVISFFVVSSKLAWPGYWTLLPVLGTYFVIASQIDNNPLLNNIIADRLGKWSYSIYLWHWPIAIFGLHFDIKYWFIFGILISVFFGFISYKFIESIKFKKYSNILDVYKIWPLYMIMFLFVISNVIRNKDGVVSRFPNAVIAVLAEKNDSNPYNCLAMDFRECVIGNKENIKAIMIGDSHADASVTALSSLIDKEKEGVVTLATASCPMIPNMDVNDPQKHCNDTNIDRIKYIKKNEYPGVPVILMARYAFYVKGIYEFDEFGKDAGEPAGYFYGNKNASYQERIKFFKKNIEDSLCLITKNNPVFISYPIPEMGFDVPKKVADNLFYHKKTNTSIPYREYIKRNQIIRQIIENAARKCNAKTLDPALFLCHGDSCISEFDGIPLYRDGNHLSEYGNKLLIPMFREVFYQ